MVSLFLVLLAAVPAIAVPEEIQYHHARRVNENQDRIIGGVPADIEEFPFLIYMGGCGGSIITESWVLTAAHCLESKKYLPRLTTMVRGGSSHRTKGGVVRNVSKQVSNKYPPNDIGLLKVDEPWPLNGITISLARLPRQDDPIPVGSLGTVTGWGGIDMEDTPPKILMKTEVRVISHVSCWFHYFWVNASITDKNICTLGAGETPSQSWKGDSGGPVLVNGEVAGIVSMVPNVSWVPDINTRVSSYIDWIEENVGPLPRDM